MGRQSDAAEDWFIAAVIVVIGLYVVGSMIVSFVTSLPFYGQLIFGGGVLTAILGGAKQVFSR